MATTTFMSSQARHWPIAIALAALLVLAGCDRESPAPEAKPSPSPPREAGGAPHGSAQEHDARGTVTAIDSANRRITIAHEPVSSLNWPAMTMAFTVAPEVDLEGLQSGQKVNFTFVEVEGEFRIRQIRAQ